MRFAEVFPDLKIVQSLIAHSDWTHFPPIIRLADPRKHDFDTGMCRRRQGRGADSLTGYGETSRPGNFQHEQTEGSEIIQGFWPWISRMDPDFRHLKFWVLGLASRGASRGQGTREAEARLGHPMDCGGRAPRRCRLGMARRAGEFHNFILSRAIPRTAPERGCPQPQRVAIPANRRSRRLLR